MTLLKCVTVRKSKVVTKESYSYHGVLSTCHDLPEDHSSVTPLKDARCWTRHSTVCSNALNVLLLSKVLTDRMLLWAQMGLIERHSVSGVGNIAFFSYHIHLSNQMFVSYFWYDNLSLWTALLYVVQRLHAVSLCKT